MIQFHPVISADWLLPPMLIRGNTAVGMSQHSFKTYTLSLSLFYSWISFPASPCQRTSRPSRPPTYLRRPPRPPLQSRPFPRCPRSPTFSVQPTCPAWAPCADATPTNTPCPCPQVCRSFFFFFCELFMQIRQNQIINIQWILITGKYKIMQYSRRRCM